MCENASLYWGSPPVYNAAYALSDDAEFNPEIRHHSLLMRPAAFLSCRFGVRVRGEQLFEQSVA